MDGFKSIYSHIDISIWTKIKSSNVAKMKKKKKKKKNHLLMKTQAVIPRHFHSPSHALSGHPSGPVGEIEETNLPEHPSALAS